MPIRRLLIVEYLCSGLADLAEASPSMLAEGKSMLTALLQDASRIEGTRVSTLWSDRLGELAIPAVDVRRTTSIDNAIEAWRYALCHTDAVYVIAPETDGILSQMCVEATEAGIDVLNCTPQVIGKTGDKWETFLTLSTAGIDTIPTQLLSEYLMKPAFESPNGPVIKPRDGCGSEGIRIVRNEESLLPSPPGRGAGGEGADALDQWIVQPFMAGQPASIAVIFDDRGQPRDVFPLALQHLTSDLRYRGGRIPYDPGQPMPNASHFADLARRIGDTIPGLRGYVGIDLLLPPNGSAIVVEINPRLTTSYIGYRALTRMNLAERWLSADSQELKAISWSAGCVTFTADGSISLSS